MSQDLVKQIVACPSCKGNLRFEVDGKSAVCEICRNTFNRQKYSWDFTPTHKTLDSPIWGAWQQVQDNGIASYQADPSNNLSVGKRDDCSLFAEFCCYHGLVLDVGCGPQPCPAYFDLDSAQFVGVDPLVDDAVSQFLRIKALAEYLPFRDHIFDHVLFSTTLDHFAEPLIALQEAMRVCKSEGEIDIWFGEKSTDAPRPAVSPEWYQSLKKPELADDIFHIKRLNAIEINDLIEKAGLVIIDCESHKIDEFRTNYFYRVKTASVL